MKTYDWEEKYEQGLRGEGLLDGWLCSYGFTVRNVSRRDERNGIDRVVTLLDGSEVTVEYKTDYLAKRTGRAYIETVSYDNGQHRKEGWAHTCNADVLFYWVYPQMIYQLNPVTIRWCLPHWTDRFKEVKVENRSYVGRGLLVPLPTLLGVSQKVFTNRIIRTY